MSYYINTFLQTEITCLPRIINRYTGKYFNNTLCNGGLWIFCIWTCLHVVFDNGFDAFLKKIKYPEYIRSRLTQALWYCGFYMASLFYCIITLVSNNIEIFNTNRTFTLSDNDRIPSQLVLGLIILSMFYAHAFVWEFWNNGFSFTAIDHLLLTLFMVFAYMFRWLELTFTLAIIVSVQQLSLEMTRILFIFGKPYAGELIFKLILSYSFYGVLAMNVLAHFILVPLHFIIPIGNSLLDKDNSEGLLLLLNVILWSWIAVQIYISPSLRLMQHYICHKNDFIANNDCPDNYIECVLFPPRTDITYKILNMKAGVKERKAKMDKKKKPKNRTMLVQTLKCAMALKRKMNRQQRINRAVSEMKMENSVNSTDDVPCTESPNVVDSFSLNPLEIRDESCGGEDVDKCTKDAGLFISDSRDTHSSKLILNDDEINSSPSPEL